MDNVIPFPKNLDDFKEVGELISQVGRKAGLSEEMIANVTEEYHEYYNQLFVEYEASIEFPADLGINQEQTDAILQAHTDAIQGICQHHTKQISHACHIILGILIKKQLNSIN